ncbi:hypothetical protein Tco_1195122 [Tanacetum coccineum]
MNAMTSRLRTRIPSRPRLEMWQIGIQSPGYSEPVILFGVIHAIIPEVPIVPADPLTTPEVGAVFVTLPTRVLDLVDYSSSAFDPSEDSLPLAPELPLVSPFLYSDDLKANNESEPADQRPERHESLAVHDVMVSRWRDRVASRPSSPSGSSSHDTLAPSSEFPIAHVVAPTRHSSTASDSYLTRKRVGPFPTRRLALRRVSHRSSDRHSSLHSSSSDSSSDCSSDTSSGSPSNSLSDTSSVHSSGFDASGQTHSGPSTRVASSRSLDSSSLSSGPSRKRCISPTTSVPSSTPVLRFIAPTYADLLPPHLGIGDRVRVDTEDGIGMGVEIATSDIREDKEEFEAEASAGGTMEIVVDPLVTCGISESTRGNVPDLEDTIYDIVHYMSEVPLDRITEFETAQRQLEAGQLMASRERVGLADRIRRLGWENLKDMTITRSRMTSEAIEELIAQRVAEALANYKATRAANALEAKSQSQNGSDGDNGNGGNGNGGNRRGNHGDRGNNRNGNPNENGRGAMPVTRKMETKLWNLTMKNNDLAAYTQRFQELSLLCTRMVPGEEDRIKRYVGGLPDNIQGNVMSAEPTRFQDEIRLANSLIDQKLKGYAIGSAENKRKFKSNQRDTCIQQPQFKRQNVGGPNVAKAYTVDGNEGRVYVGPHPLCNKCKLHHVGPCTVTCRSCGKKDFPKLKNQNHGNKPVIPEARGKSYAIGGGDANSGSNVVTGTFLLNNHYASVLFDLGADQSFVSTTFSTLLDVIPDTLDVSNPFNIDLMLVELGRFDVIISMDWLANNHAVIVCDEKIICFPFEDKILIVQGDRSDKEKKSTLSIISCTKTQKYMEKGCQVFLAQVTKKVTEVKSQEKRLDDVPIVSKFPKDLPGLPPA